MALRASTRLRKSWPQIFSQAWYGDAGELLDNVLKGVFLAVLSPGCDGAVLSSRQREARDRIFGAVKPPNDSDSGNRVRSLEIDQMGGCSNTGNLLGGDAPVAKIMQFVVQVLQAPRGLQEVPSKDLLLLSGVGGHSDGVPDLNQKDLHPVGEPVALGVGALHREQNIAPWNDASLRHRLDFHGQVSVVFLQNVPPAGLVEDLMAEVLSLHALSLLDLLWSHHLPSPVFVQDVLKTVEDRLAVLDFGVLGVVARLLPALKIGVDFTRVGRLLLVMRHLVGIGRQQYVKLGSSGLHLSPRM